MNCSTRGTGVVAEGSKTYVEIKNSTVSDHSLNGIEVAGGAFVGAEEMVIENNHDHGVQVVELNSQLIIEDSTIRDNDLDGIKAIGGTLEATRVEVYDNKRNGVNIDSQIGDFRITDSIIEKNHEHGVWVTDGAVTITRTTISDNDMDGVHVDSKGSAVIRASTIKGNGRDGVNSNGGGTVDIFDSAIKENHRDGVNIGRMSTAIIERTTIKDNDRYGVAARYGGTVTIGDSTITGNGYYGLLAESWAGDVNNSTKFLNDPSIIEATNVIVSGNGIQMGSDGYEVLNRGGQIKLIGSQVLGKLRNEAGRLPINLPEFVDFGEVLNFNDDVCLYHDGTITVADPAGDYLIGDPPVLLADQSTCTPFTQADR